MAAAQAVWGPVGIFWATLAATWTTALVAGMVFLHVKRDTPLLRMRSMHFSFAAVILLHLYWLPVQLGYVIGAFLPPFFEFWVMSIYFPFGIALFQASNSEFLHVAQAQERFVRQGSIVNSLSKPSRDSDSYASSLRRSKYPRRMLVYVGAALSVQALVSVVIFAVSRKFHPSWGIPGTEVNGTEMEQKAQQGRGWEWWPSIFWQVFWVWIFAPIILWKARRIHDTHGWRLQTMACCVAGLHACPLWLVAIYVPQMEPVNKYFNPPQWVAVSVMILEIFTIMLPCIQVLRHQSLQQETLEIIARWETQHRPTSAGVVPPSWKSLAAAASDPSLARYSSSDSLFVMGALEYVLENNPEPLRQFSALHDFSGENIAFLTNVAEWKAALPYSAKPTTKGAPRRAIPQDMRREMFGLALRIYACFVSPGRAEFPVNIASAEREKLEDIFESAASAVYGTGKALDPAFPFNSRNMSPLPSPSYAPSANDSIEKDKRNRRVTLSSGPQFWGDISEAFDGTVFDQVERSVKYLVLTNTWPKFVKSRHGISSRQQVDA